VNLTENESQILLDELIAQEPRMLQDGDITVDNVRVKLSEKRGQEVDFKTAQRWLRIRERQGLFVSDQVISPANGQPMTVWRKA